MSDPRCRAGKGCVNRTADGASRTTGDDTICHGCVVDIQKALDDLPHLALALSTMKGTWGGVSYEARVMSSKEAPTPLHVGVVDLVDEAEGVLRYAGGYTVVDLITQYKGVDLALLIRKVHRKAADAVGFERVWQRRVAPCPECHMPSLGGWIGEDMIRCSNPECLAGFTKTEYEDVCINQARNEKRK